MRRQGGAGRRTGSISSSDSTAAKNAAGRAMFRSEEEAMASKQTEELNKLYLEWVAALQANPGMPLDELRHMFEQWERITGEPGGVNYIETDAGGVPAMWAAPKGCAQDRVLLCAHGGGYALGSMYTHRKTYGHVAKSDRLSRAHRALWARAR